MKMKKIVWLVLIAALGAFMLASGPKAVAQEEAKEVAAGLELSEGPLEEESAAGFFSVVGGSGILGIILWVAIFGCSMAGVALIVDSFITIQQKKLAPERLAEKVREAMEQGDLMKAVGHCEDEPGPLASILQAGFANVEEGFEAVEEAIGVTADLESEKLMQRVNYLNVVGNLSPMLGLLGTVQGMIAAFATLGTASGAAKQAMLALDISQALYTTAAGLCVAIPAVAFYFFFRNRSTNIILGMEAMTMDLIKVLRNVEVVED
jgi:biopolymer transport protein ExbB